MGLLKYLGKVEVLKVNGKRTREIYDGGIFGVSCLYPEGTERVVKKYFWLTRKVKLPITASCGDFFSSEAPNHSKLWGF